MAVNYEPAAEKIVGDIFTLIEAFRDARLIAKRLISIKNNNIDLFNKVVDDDFLQDPKRENLNHLTGSDIISAANRINAILTEIDNSLDEFDKVAI